MIQFNLLPDVKQEYLKANRNKRLVIGASLLVIAASLFVFVVLVGIVDVLQKKNLHDLNNDVSKYTSQLKSTPELNKILTVQNQLNSLSPLHDQKAVASRLFNYLTQLTPAAATISEMSVDYQQHTMTITGAANSLDIVNIYADTLKFTTYKIADSNPSTSDKKAFSGVVLSEFRRNESGAHYTILLSYDTTIFDSASKVSLTVPNIISTRSATELPTDLFKSGGTTQQ